MSSGSLHAQAQQEEGFQELTRGPVHEAFATTVSYDPEPGMIVTTEPPDLIEEVPPDQRPAGDNVTWISGYWGWDQEESDFIWISGIWRNLPPDRQWVPGYWGDLETGWQWTSGYWAEEEAQEVAYLPQPPKSVETGPNIAAPSSSHIWVSGTWVNRESRYAWRPGYWEPGQENWTWVPAHYQWTRRGYVFIEGYWDYDVNRRGVVFAPVRFQRQYYSRPNYYYTPSTVISLNVFINHLFVRPNYGHYYFGDYYAPRYRDNGFYASYSYHSGRRGYDPIYAYSRWENRSDRNWERSRRDNFTYYRDNEAARPPQTWAAMNLRSKGERRGSRDNDEFAQPLAVYAEQREGRQRFEKVSKDNRDRYVAQRQQTREFSKSRRLLENRADERSANERKNVRSEKLAKSPVVGKRSAQMAASEAPPKRREARSDKRGDKKSDAGTEAGRVTDSGKRPADPKNADRPRRGDREAKESREQDEKSGKEKSPRGRDKETSAERREKRPESAGEQKVEPAAGKSGKNEARRAKTDKGPEKKLETAPQRMDQPAKDSTKPESAPGRRDAGPRAARQPEKPAERQAKPEPQKAPASKPPQAEKREAPKQQVRQRDQQRQAKPDRNAERPQRAAEPPQKAARPEREPKSPKAEEKRSKRNSSEDEKKKKE